MNIASGDTYGLLLQSNTIGPVIIGIKRNKQSSLLANLERLGPLRVIVKHVKRRALPLGHHQGGRGAWSGGPDATNFNRRISLVVHHKDGLHLSAKPLHGAEVMK
jgi:hypothetical protein